MSESGRSSIHEVDCTRTGVLRFVSDSVFKKMQKLVKQTKTSEEPLLEEDNLVPCKVLHTGEPGKGFGLFAAKNIPKVGGVAAPCLCPVKVMALYSQTDIPSLSLGHFLGPLLRRDSRHRLLPWPVVALHLSPAAWAWG